MRGFMRNHSQMQIKRITGLPLAVRGMCIFVFLEEISPQIFLSSIFQFPEIMAIGIITTWVSSWQNNPLWKTNKIMFQKFPSEPVFLHFFFFVLHFIVSKMEYMILMLEGNSIVSPISSSTCTKKWARLSVGAMWSESNYKVGFCMEIPICWNPDFWLAAQTFFNQNKIAGSKQ